MMRLSPLVILRRFTRLALWVGAFALLGAGLVRLTVWATGTEHLHSDITQGPHIFEWEIDAPAFGGMSALLIDADGGAIFAGGDHGLMVQAHIRRSDTGQITGLEDPVLTPVSLSSGRPPTTFKMDLEALTRAPKGGMFVAFEGFVRIERLSKPEALPTATHPWNSFVDLFGNQAFEALATLPDGRVLAINEAPLAPTRAGSVIYEANRWRSGPNIPVTDGFMITGADIGPDGCLYLVERRYRVASGFTSRLRRLSGGPQDWEETLLYVSAPARIGNAEGVAVWEDDKGQIVIDVLTDNGFWPLTPTRLIEMRTAPHAGCHLTF